MHPGISCFVTSTHDTDISMFCFYSFTYDTRDRCALLCVCTINHVRMRILRRQVMTATPWSCAGLLWTRLRRTSMPARIIPPYPRWDGVFLFFVLWLHLLHHWIIFYCRIKHEDRAMFYCTWYTFSVLDQCWKKYTNTPDCFERKRGWGWG